MGVIVKGESESEALKRAQTLIKKICTKQNFNYAVFLDDNQSIVFGEEYITREILAFDKIDEHHENDDDWIRGGGAVYGKDRYKSIFESLKIKRKPAYGIGEGTKLGAFIFNRGLDREEKELGFPPRLYDYKGKPILSKNNLLAVFKEMGKVEDDLIFPFYLVPVDIHFESTRRQMRYAAREFKKLPEFKDKTTVISDVYIGGITKESEKMSENCKACKKPLSRKALHLSNNVAIENGYCSWMCMIGDLGEKKAMSILQKDSGKPAA